MRTLHLYNSDNNLPNAPEACVWLAEPILKDS